MILLCGFISLSTLAQEPIFSRSFWLHNWKLEIKTGGVKMLTPLPEKSMYYTNNLNIPVGQFGPLGSFSFKKGITPHIEMGYNFDYLRVKGDAMNVDQNKVEVLTQIYSHGYQFQYNIKKNDEIKPPFNYFVYFKLGGIYIKNNPVEEGTHDTQDMPYPFAVLTGLGAGVNYQLNNNFSLTGSMEINKSGDRVGEIYRFHKLFYPTNHGVNFMQISFGLAWWFNLGSKKSSSDYLPEGETQQKPTRHGRTRKDGSSIWYDSSRGKTEKGRK